MARCEDMSFIEPHLNFSTARHSTVRTVCRRRGELRALAVVVGLTDSVYSTLFLSASAAFISLQYQQFVDRLLRIARERSENRGTDR